MTNQEWARYWSAFWKKQKSLAQREKEQTDGDDTRSKSQGQDKEVFKVK